MNKWTVVPCFVAVIGCLPLTALAEEGEPYGPVAGDREFSIAGTGSSDRKFDSGTFGFTGDLGWYLTDRVILGGRQSVNYASIEGESIDDDFWNGATRIYLDYQFAPTDRIRPFVGASLGGIYGDGVKDSGFGGVEVGGKYYVREKTYLLARAEYQAFFEDSDEVEDAFREDAAWAYTFGVGYNF